MARPESLKNEPFQADTSGSKAGARATPWRDLEWPELLEVVARRAVSELGSRRLLALEPAEDETTARFRAELSAEALELARGGARLPAFDVQDITRSVERVRRAGVADGAELCAVRRVLAGALDLSRYVGEHGEAAPNLARHLSIAPGLAGLRDEIQRCIEEDGTVADRASAELSRARRQVTQLRQQVRARLGELIHRYREALQDAYFAERDGRYVLPVRADAPFRVEGIVLGSSASGATLYVEPRELAELGNRLKLAEAAAEHEAAQVLARLSEELAPHADAVLGALEATVRADVLHAIADYAQTVGAHVLAWGERGSLELQRMRHPLLSARGIAVVPNDLPLGAGRGLVLSGPNAGGKTVALKCLGLAALMQASGLPIPAEPTSRVGFFDAVYSDIGDDQSLARSLSTFSGHIERVRDILSDAGPGVLVLLDELAGGTDPEEGAALAVAVLEELVRRGAAVAVTTHYERLKDLGHESDVIDNAAVGFDFERLEPTFRLELGTPGASSALAVARRHGLPERVVERARGVIPEISQRREALLHELARQRIELERLREEALQEKQQQAELRRRLEQERQKQAERERLELTQAGQELARAIRDARADVLRVRKGLRDSRALGEVRQAEKEIDEAARLVALGSELEQRTRAGAPERSSPELLTVGARVRLAGLGTVASIIEAPSRGQVRVLVGAMKLSVPVERIEPLTGRDAREAPRQRGKMSFHARAPSTPALVAPPRIEEVTLDLRGVRVEEGLERVDAFVDELLRRGELAGYVLHGHGTGAMKSAVRDHLRAHSVVVSSRAAERDEGGDAFTVFWLAS